MHRISGIRLVVLTAAVAACLLCPDEVFAQGSSLFGDRGPLGQSTSGSGTSSSGSRSGTSGTSRQSTGSGLGQTGTGRLPQLGDLSANVGQGFTGRGNNTGQFVGNRLAGQGNAPQTGQSSGLGNRAGQLNRPGNGAGSNRLGNQTDQSRHVIRPRQRIAFEFPKLGVTAINNSLETTVKKVASRGLAIDGVTWAIDEGGLVVLRGEVESERARKMAELIVRLEPGVRKVQNELTVKADTALE